MFAAGNSGFDVNEIPVLDVSGGKIALVGEKHVASSENTAIAIVDGHKRSCCTGQTPPFDRPTVVVTVRSLGCWYSRTYEQSHSVMHR
jgi:hypothetical protein